MDFNIDFDGTCVTHDFPRVGADIGSARVLKKLVEKGHRLILFTMRSHRPYRKEDGTLDENGLIDAINWFGENGLPLHGIQSNPTQKQWTDSPKSYAQVMIDDSALGCPLKIDKSISPRPFVDWEAVEILLQERKLID
jgi:hypothetical protein